MRRKTKQPTNQSERFGSANADASEALLDTEKTYAHIEKEMHMIVFSLEYFHQ